jgi:hypothetical protein
VAAELGNVGAFAAAWAQKELVVNTQDPRAAVLHGVGDIRGAQQKLASVSACGGWQALQRQVRGAPDIDTAEWCSITIHQLSSGGQDASAAASPYHRSRCTHARLSVKLLMERPSRRKKS